MRLSLSKIAKIVTILFLVLPPVRAEEEVKPEKWTLTKLLEKASANSATVKAAEKDSISAENQAYQAGKWDNPEVSANFGEKSDSSTKGNVFQVSLLQTVPVFGQKSILEKIGNQQFLISQTEKQIQSLILQHEVVKRAYRLAAVDEQMKHVSHRKDKIHLVEQYLKSRPFASPSQLVEKSLIENRLREIEEKFVQISATREKEWQSLNILLNFSSPIYPELNWFTSPTLPNRESLLEKIQKDNLEITKQSKVVATSELQIEQAGKKVYPEVRVGGGYNQEILGTTEKSYYGMLQLSIPLLDRGGYGLEAAKAKREAETYRLEQQRRETVSKFGEAWAELTEGTRRLELFPLSLVPKLENQMKVTEANWRKGLVQVASFLELENQVHEQAVKVFDAQMAYVEALSHVLLSSGQSFPVEGK